MRDFKQLSDSISEDSDFKYLKDIYRLIAEDTDSPIAHTVSDSSISIKPISHSQEKVRAIRDAMIAYQESNMVIGSYQTPEDWARKSAENAFKFIQTSVKMKGSKDGKQVIDSWYNSVTGTGTSSDPGFYNTADIPIYISPNQATAYYASGGIPKVIIDKKVNGPFINGYSFKGDFSDKQLDDFKTHYHRLGFETACKNGLRDSLIFGGAGIIPHFSFDSVASGGEGVFSYAKDLSELGELGKKQITRFWTADRWNMVLMPDTDIA